MGYLGTKPANSPLTSELIPDGLIATSDIADGAITTAKIANGAVTQVDLATGVAGTGPAFRAFLPSSQTVTNIVDTKITLSSETFDTASCFNNTGSTVGGIPAYAFLPNVAGYYQINATIGANAITSLTYNYIQIRKNNSSDVISIYGPYSATSNYGTASGLIFLNGSTDYIELFVQLAGSGTLRAEGTFTTLSGSLVRAT
jgi:hypothetical protein